MTKTNGKVTFIAKCHNQVLTVRKANTVRNFAGEVVNKDPGLRIEFQQHLFTTEDPELIEFVRNHRFFNSQITEEGNEPDRIRPSLRERIDAIMAASAGHDPDALVDIIEDERATHNRVDVIEVAEQALERMAEAVEQANPASEPAHEGEGNVPPVAVGASAPDGNDV